MSQDDGNPGSVCDELSLSTSTAYEACGNQQLTFRPSVEKLGLGSDDAPQSIPQLASEPPKQARLKPTQQQPQSRKAMRDSLMQMLVNTVEFIIPPLQRALKYDAATLVPLFPVR